jgi:hypothetical protein
MQKALRMLAAGAALIVVFDGALLVARAGDDDGDTEVLGVRFDRTTTTGATTTSPSRATLEGDEPPSTTSPTVPIIEEGGSTTTAAPPTTRPRRATTTTSPPGQPRQVNERSDNAASFTYANGGGALSPPVSDDPSDPFRFLVFAQDRQQDGTAELRAELANQTQRDMAFPGGMVLRFSFAHNGEFWKTVELRFPDVTSLPARGSLEVESLVPLDKGRGRYDVVGEVLVEYR